HGEKVFVDDKEAANKLCELIKDKKSSLPHVVLQDSVDRILRVDRLLASVAIQDAIYGNAAQKAIAEAQDELARGDIGVTNDKCDEGIDHYRKAWFRAARATVWQSIQLAKGHVRLEIRGKPGQVYVIQASANLTDWVSIASRIADAVGGIAFEDANAGNFRA